MRFVLPVVLVSLALLAGCAGPELRDTEALEPGYASPPAPSGLLAETAQRIESQYGDGYSGYHLLDSNYDGLYWRLALIDSATTSLDILTYLWYPDISGQLILERAVLAAQRGVRVRLLIDDLLTVGQDQGLVNIANHPNIELRLFNPWRSRRLSARLVEGLAELERANMRMHDKLLIADGRATILGGRNTGDHYFGLSPAYSFHDLDVLAFGDLADEADDMFDHTWNSEWVASATQLTLDEDPQVAAEGWLQVRKQSRTSPGLKRFPREPKYWKAELEELAPMLRPGTGHVIYDEFSAGQVGQQMASELSRFFSQAQSELFITNAYIIPGQPAIDFLEGMIDAGVDVRILTNSLASHDVPAVNAHYEKWRGPLVDAGVQLYEFRPDAAIKGEFVDTSPVHGEFSGLHTKAAVVDRRHVFIGSMNLDPRSVNINAEMGAVIDSPELAEDLRALMLRDMSPENAWQIVRNDKGRIAWVSDTETTTSQPSRGFSQKVMNVLFKMAPKDLY